MSLGRLTLSFLIFIDLSPPPFLIIPPIISATGCWWLESRQRDNSNVRLSLLFGQSPQG